jgi:hypothetical protein
MNDGTSKAYEQELKRTTRKLRLLAKRLAVAQAERDRAIHRSKDSLSRRRVAELTEMTSGRVQQIIDRRDRGEDG